jgi:superfamily I DNA/RNA helicase
MKSKVYNFDSKFLAFLLIIISLGITGCNLFGDDSENGGGLLGPSNDNEKAVQLVDDANDNLQRIKRLYQQNNQKFEEFKKALGDKDIEKVKKLADELQYAINDGYVLAENAKEHISKAHALNINDSYKEYLQLKESSLDMQIKAFDFRRQSAKLFRDKFGTENELDMKTAAETFKQNEEKFAKYMKDAEEFSKQADAVAKRAMQKKN